MLLLSKKKSFCTFNHFYSEVFKKSKIAQIYYYDPQSAGINLQSPQSDSTPWTLTSPIEPNSAIKLFIIDERQNATTSAEVET